MLSALAFLVPSRSPPIFTEQYSILCTLYLLSEIQSSVLTGRLCSLNLIYSYFLILIACSLSVSDFLFIRRPRLRVEWAWQEPPGNTLILFHANLSQCIAPKYIVEHVDLMSLSLFLFCDSTVTRQASSDSAERQAPAKKHSLCVGIRSANYWQTCRSNN